MVNITEILKLPSAEKILLMEKIWDSLNSEELTLSREQKEELDRRLERIKSGKAKFFTWEQVKSELKK